MIYKDKSQIKNAGLGLFTDSPIKKGKKVVEYLGEIITWAEAEKRDTAGRGGYVYHITDKHCIDAYKTPQHLARYANDARGIGRTKGLRNNSIYETHGRRGYIVCTRNLKAGEEIFVWYGNDYWKPWLESYEAAKKKERAAKRKANQKKVGKRRK